MNARARVRGATIGWVVTDVHSLAGGIHLGVGPIGRSGEANVHAMISGALAYALSVAYALATEPNP